MAPRSKSKRKARGGGRGSAGNSSRSLVSLIQNGKRLKPSPHPPEFTSQPWFQLTVRMQDLIADNTVLSVLDNLSTQLSGGSPIVDVTEIVFRLRSVRIWGALVAMNSSSHLQPVVVRFNNVELTPRLTGSIVSVFSNNLETFTDYPDQVSRASVGFEWPMAQQALSLGTNATGSAVTNQTLFTVLSGAGPGSIAYVNLLWRFRSTSVAT
jgi:hypothetical protein